MVKNKAKKALTDLPQTEFFQKVGDICAAVNVVTNERELLEASLKGTMSLFDAKRGSIFILNENGKDLILKIAQGMAKSEEDKLVKRLGEGVVGRVAQMKKPIFVDDISKDERFGNFRSRASYQTPSFICAPLLLKDKLLGVINITDKESGNRFSERELQLLDFLSSQIALNYRRIQLYKKFKSIIKKTQNLQDELGKSSKEATHLKKQVVQHEKLASIGKLAGGIAHEFNNPLDGVMRYTNLCLEQVNEEEVVHGYLLEIKEGLNRMANIVKSLLACSRNTDPTLQTIDPNLSVKEVIDTLQAEIIQKGIELKAHLSTDVPDLIDLGLERVVTNLLRNAIDAVDKNGRVDIYTRLEDTMLIIEVKDNGCGIDIEKIEQIFEPFYTTKDIQKGCGLGLTIVSEVLKSYNGEINVESELKAGTTFTIKIPINLNHE